MLRQTDDIALVRVTLVQFAHEEVANLRLHVVLVHVVLLEHVLELSLESTEDRLVQTIGEDGQPFEHLVSGEMVVVASHVIRGEGIHIRSTDTVEEGKEILGGRVLRCLEAGAVDTGDERVALYGIRGLRVLVIETDDLLVERFLFLPIQRTDTLRTLEEHVLQVVRETGTLGRFVDSSGANGYVTLYVRLVMVFP